MSKQKKNSTPPVNLKEQKAVHTFEITIRDRDHFYKIVNLLNSTIGKGEENWTMEGRVLRSLKNGPVTRKVYLFRPDSDSGTVLYLSLV